jgi:hypothetical protein
VDDRDQRVIGLGGERDRDLGGVLADAAQVPDVGQAVQAITSPQSCSVPSDVVS